MTTSVRSKRSTPPLLRKSTNQPMTQKITLITGGSSGIGRALANAIGRERGRVVLIGRREEALKRVAQEVTMFGGEALPIVSDTRDPSSVPAALSQAIQTWGRVDTAFLSAGIARPFNLERVSAKTVIEIFETNVFGAAYWLEALQPVMRAQPEGGTIAVLSSLAADRAFPGGGAAYSASKAAVSSLWDGLRAPLAYQNIRLVTIEPGFIRTPMTAKMDWMPMAIEAPESAKIILDGLKRGDSVIRFPKPAALTMRLMSLLPPALLDRLDRNRPPK